MRVKVTAPVAGYTGKVGIVAFADGVAELDSEVHAHQRALAYFRRRGYTVEEINPAAVADAPVDPDAAPEMPKRSGTTEAWRAWATHPKGGGMTADEAATKSRDELVAQFATEATQ